MGIYSTTPNFTSYEPLVVTFSRNHDWPLLFANSKGIYYNTKIWWAVPYGVFRLSHLWVKIELFNIPTSRQIVHRMPLKKSRCKTIRKHICPKSYHVTFHTSLRISITVWMGKGIYYILLWIYRFWLFLIKY